MTQLYITDCTPLKDPQIIAQLLPRLDVHRQDKILALQSLQKKAQSAAAGLLLSHIFGKKATYRYSEQGKPFLVDGCTYFSISHSQNWVAIAVSQVDVGADLQVISPVRTAVLRRVFTQEEQNYIGEDAERFTECWVRKEAYAKYTGMGLAAHLTTPIPEAPRCTGRYADVVYCIYGDTDVEITTINIKDLL